MSDEPKVGQQFWARRGSTRERMEIAALERQMVVRTHFGARWKLAENPTAILDGVTWEGTPMPADPNPDVQP